MSKSNGQRHISDEQERQVLALWRGGMSAEKIGERIGKSKRYVDQLINRNRKRHGPEVVPFRRPRGKNRDDMPIDTDTHRYIEMWNQGLSEREIAWHDGHKWESKVNRKLANARKKRPDLFRRPHSRTWHGMQSNRIALYWRWHLMRQSGMTCPDIARQTIDEWEEGITITQATKEIWYGTDRIFRVLNEYGYEELRPYVDHVKLDG